MEKGITNNNTGVKVYIKCKHLHNVTLLIPKEKDAQDLQYALLTGSRICEFFHEFFCLIFPI